MCVWDLSLPCRLPGVQGGTWVLRSCPGTISVQVAAGPGVGHLFCIPVGAEPLKGVSSPCSGATVQLAWEPWGEEVGSAGGIRLPSTSSRASFGHTHQATLMSPAPTRGREGGWEAPHGSLCHLESWRHQGSWELVHGRSPASMGMATVDLPSAPPVEGPGLWVQQGPGPQDVHSALPPSGGLGSCSRPTLPHRLSVAVGLTSWGQEPV